MGKIGILIFIFLGIIFSCEKHKTSFNADDYLKFSLEQIEKSLDSLPDVNRAPRYIPPGEVRWNTTGITSWTSGFWPGILWYMYEFSGDEQLRDEAHKWTMPLAEIKDRVVKNHDLGFMIFCSFGNAYRLTGDIKYKEYILETADSLATLFNPNTGTILSWPGRKRIGNVDISGRINHNTIIDNMMNLELLFWASKNGGNPELYEIAKSHAQATMRDFIRKDYSSYHVVVYDSLTGDVGHRITHQGFANESMWARGQAWGIYGFTVAYRETGLQEFLVTAMNMAQVFINRLPEDYVPFWDFDAPDIPNAEKDASAAAVAASAMLELSTLIEDTEKQFWFREKAYKILESLSRNYLSDGSNHAVLWHSTGNKNSNSEVDVPIIYADYYFIEALLRAKK
jgi:unsaturated chondroitin disaccharide hydrolase